MTLEDVYNGAKKQVEIKRYRLCESCHGKGTNKKGINTKCNGCKGHGAKLLVRQTNMGLIQQQVTCDECGGNYLKVNNFLGEGNKINEKDKCQPCKGNKVIMKEKVLDIDVEKGAPDKKRYVFQGESDEVPDADPGDIYVEILIEKHKRMIRRGADLVYEAEINLLESLTGFTLIFEHLDEKKLLIKNKEGEIIKPGMVKTVKDLGMPLSDSPFRFGNLYLRFKIVFPEKFDNLLKEKIENILISQKNNEIIEDCQEKYFTTEYSQEDDNTHPSGGKKEENRNNSNQNHDEEESQMPKQTRCEHQ